jgi:hypothetical protein
MRMRAFGTLRHMGAAGYQATGILAAQRGTKVLVIILACVTNQVKSCPAFVCGEGVTHSMSVSCAALVWLQVEF